MTKLIGHIQQNICNIKSQLKNEDCKVTCTRELNFKDLVDNRDDLIDLYCDQEQNSGLLHLYEFVCDVSIAFNNHNKL